MRLDGRAAARAIQDGTAPVNLVVEGDLHLGGLAAPLRLPVGLTVFGYLLLTRSGIEALPGGLRVHHGQLVAEGCTRLTAIGRDVRAPWIDLSRCRGLRSIEHPLQAASMLKLEGCHGLERTGALKADVVDLTGCSRLRQVGPITAANLALRGCVQLRALPAGSRVERYAVDRHTGLPLHPEYRVDAATARHWIVLGKVRGGLRVKGALDLRGAIEVTALPDPLEVDGELLLEGCTSLRTLPRSLSVTGRLDLAGVDPRVKLPDDLRAGSVRLPDGHERPGRPPGDGALSLLAQAPSLVWRGARFFWSLRGGGGPRPEPGVSATEAQRRLRAGSGRRMVVDERLELQDLPLLTELPPGLEVRGDLIVKNLPRLVRLSDDLRVHGRLSIADCPALEVLPARLSAQSLSLARCPGLATLPPTLFCHGVSLDDCAGLEDLSGLEVGGLEVVRCARVSKVPSDVRAHRLTLRDLPELSRLPDTVIAEQVDFANLPRVTELPSRFRFARASLSNLPGVTALTGPVEAEHLELDGLPGLRELPPMRLSQSLAIRGCAGIDAIPVSVEAPVIECRRTPVRDFQSGARILRRLALQGCAELRQLPTQLTVVGELDLGGCRALPLLPEGLRVPGRLDLEDCSALAALPSRMSPPGRVELGGTRLDGLPPGWERVPTTWHRLPLDSARLFLPPAALATALLEEPNAEVRRALLEKLGLERLVEATQAETLDADHDASGPRELLRITTRDPEPIVALRVRCPSTARTFVLRVPPNQRNCRAAAAWLAGFRDPDDYNPVLET